MLEWLQNIVFLALCTYFLHVFDLGLVMRLFFLNKGPMKLYLIHQKVNSLLFRLVQILHNLPQIPAKAKFLQRWLQVYIIKKSTLVISRIVIATFLESLKKLMKVTLIVDLFSTVEWVLIPVFFYKVVLYQGECFRRWRTRRWQKLLDYKNFIYQILKHWT
jgi:hypothetical protein